MRGGTRDLDADILRVLTVYGLKKTRVRVEMLRLLLTTEHPVSQSDFLRVVGTNSTHRVSIYRNVLQMKRHGIIHDVEKNRYVFKKPKADLLAQIFFFCPVCSSHIEAEDGRAIQKFTDSLKQLGFLSLDYGISVRGKCLRCSHKASQEHGK